MLVERALQLQPQHVLAYHVKGSLLLTLARPELAIHTFLAAKELSKDVHSFKGLVDAYLAAHRYKEALGAAKDAVQVGLDTPCHDDVMSMWYMLLPFLLRQTC